MMEIRDIEPESQSGGWTRPRIIFLSISAALLLVFLASVREVLLPFVLAVVLAYVLMPLVSWSEKRLRLPRSASILLVYAVVLGTLSLSTALIAPRLYQETARFARDMPRLLRETAATRGPEIERWVESYRPSSGATPKQKEPAFLIQTRPDGAQTIEIKAGVTIVEEAPGHYRLMSRDERGAGAFRVAEMLEQGVEKMLRYVELNALQVIQLGRAVIGGAARSVFMFFMVLMVAGYLMHTREGVLGFFKGLVPTRQRPGFDHWLVRLDRGLSGVVRGQLLICLVNGALSAIGFWLFGLKYWPILSLAAAALSIIPIFGAILSSIPAVLVGLTQDLWTAIWVLVWIIGIHQLEANLLNPKIIGVSAKIHPVLVVFSLLVGEHYFGLWGALLAVPVLSIAQSTFNHFRFSILEDSGPDSLGVNELLRRPPV